MADSKEIEMSDNIGRINRLKEMLSSSSTTIKQKALQLLAENPIDACLPQLEELAISDGKHETRETAIVVLSHFPIESNRIDFYEKIIQDLSEHSTVRARAVWALGKIRSEKSLAVLERALFDDNISVVYWAISSVLNQAYTPVTLQLLGKLLHNGKKPLIRITVAWLFGKMRDKRVIPALNQAIKNETDPFIRATCAWSLKHIKSVSSIPKLTAVLYDEGNSLTIREMSLAIGSLLSPKAVKEASLSKETEEYLTTHAVNALVFVLESGCKYFAKRAAAFALGKIQAPQAVPKLITALKAERNHFTRKEIIVALGEIGDSAALTVLHKAKRSRYSSIVGAAKEAIHKILENSH